MKSNKLFALCGVFSICFAMASCGSQENNNNNSASGNVVTLNVYNCADYICETDEEEGIEEGVMEQFEDYMAEKGKPVKINYSTYETNEDMYNQLRAGGIQYDLVCPSDYMIEKLIMNDMIEPINKSADNYGTYTLANYEDYGSSYIHSTFDSISAVNSADGKTYTFADYSVPYMWGTIGFMYNPENVPLEDISSWDFIWDTDYKNAASLKDSIRDTYAITTLYIYEEELNYCKDLLKRNLISSEEYNAKVTEIMNRCDDKTLALAEAALKEAKENVYEFEVDTGKENIVKGKYDANLCWSGDAVYAMDQAEEDDFIIDFVVPEEGSNVWFDGWCMPKGANVEYAQELMNFLCDPEIAAQNMDYIGYTSAIAGQDMWELCEDWYDESEDGGTIAYDLTYFFKDTGIQDEDGNDMTDFIVYISEDSVNRQLYAQYPTEEVIERCAIMHDFGDQNDKVNSMWISVKGNSISWVILVFLGVVVALIVFFEIKTSMGKRARRSRAKAK